MKRKSTSTLIVTQAEFLSLLYDLLFQVGGEHARVKILYLKFLRLHVEQPLDLTLIFVTPVTILIV